MKNKLFAYNFFYGTGLLLLFLCTRSPCFTSFCFNAPYQYTPFLNLRTVIFGLTPFGWLRSFAPVPNYSIIYCGNIITDLRLTSFVVPRVIQRSVRPPSWDCIWSLTVWSLTLKVKVKQSLYTVRALRDPGGWVSQISRQSAHEDGKVVSPTHRPPLSPRKYSWRSCLLESESTPVSNINLDFIYRSSPYRAVNTFRFGYKNHSSLVSQA